MIQLDHVSKRFGTQQALSDVTITVQDGEFVFLIGPSGAGKTTILKLIRSEFPPSDGTITINEWKLGKTKWQKNHNLRRTVGIIYQDFKLLLDRTVFENIAISLEILGKKAVDIEREVSGVLTLVGLGGKQTFFPLQLSAGEMQRVGIARAIVGGPKILLADEPTGNLDPETSMDILKILQEINKVGTTVVMATHNATLVDALSTRTVTLVEGQLVRDEAKGRYHSTHKARSSSHSDKKDHHERS